MSLFVPEEKLGGDRLRSWFNEQTIVFHFGNLSFGVHHVPPHQRPFSKYDCTLDKQTSIQGDRDFSTSLLLGPASTPELWQPTIFFFGVLDLGALGLSEPLQS